MLAVWGVAFIAAFVLIGAFLPSALTPETVVTNNPESEQAKQLIEDQIDQAGVDEVVIVRSDSAVVTDPAFKQRVQEIAKAVRGTGAAQNVLTFSDPGGETLVSQDKHATLLP